jgi:hypothetical protein
VKFLFLVDSIPGAGRRGSLKVLRSNSCSILRSDASGANEELKDGDISFADRDSLLKGGKHGPTIVPGKPQTAS